MRFLKDLEKFSEKALKDADRVRRGAIIEILSGVSMATPVDTGRAAGNWQTTVSKPAEGTVDRNGAQASIAAGPSNLGKLGESVYITNNLPYIKKLNDGSSKKSPAMFVESNVMRVAEKLKKRGYIK